MPFSFNRVAGRLAGLAALFCMGCAGLSVPPPREPPVNEAFGDDLGWWYVRFQSVWLDNREPAWHNDPMLAREVIRPVLADYDDRIVLWRFHRRAGRDNIGHQFSFIFYAPQETADRINRAIRSSVLVENLIRSGILIRVRYDDPATIKRPDIEDTSDKKWSEPIQQTWPFFIMGVSRTWLELIETIAVRNGDEKRPSDIADLQERYAEINRKINQTWKFEGNHAYLHHLSALFGYRPVVVLEKRSITF